MRLLAPEQQGLPVTIQALEHTTGAAWLADARERDMRRLEARDGTVYLDMPGAIATVRVMPVAP